MLDLLAEKSLCLQGSVVSGPRRGSKRPGLHVTAATRQRTNPGYAENVGGSGRAEGHAGGDHQLLALLGEFLPEGDAGRLHQHVGETLDVRRMDGMDAPGQQLVVTAGVPLGWTRLAVEFPYRRRMASGFVR